MTIIEKIKQSIEGATGLPFLYHAAGEINELIARCGELPVAYSFLIDSGTIDDVNGRYHERVTLAVMFCDKTEFDFNALENEQIIDRMKVKAYKWMQSLRMSNALRVVAVNNTQRLYDNTTDILTGFAVNITIEDIAGVGECELPDVVFEIKENGEYPVVGIDKVLVNVPTKTIDLVVTENDKEYIANDYGVDGFGKVKTELRGLLKPSLIRFNDGECLDENGEIDLALLDTRYTTNFQMLFYACIPLVRVKNAHLLDTSKITSTYQLFGACGNLVDVDVSTWDTSNVTNFFQTFNGCYVLESVDVSNWDVSNGINFQQFFNSCFKLKKLDLTKWNMQNATNTNNMFSGTRVLESIVGERTIEDIIDNNIGALNGLKISISFHHSSMLNRASLRAIINVVADLTGQTAQTLTLNATLIAKLTEEDIAIATAKNWTIA